MRRTKVVCTIGPASDSPEKIGALIQAGMDVARLSFSHGSHTSHVQTIGRVRAGAQRLKATVSLPARPFR